MFTKEDPAKALKNDLSKLPRAIIHLINKKKANFNLDGVSTDVKEVILDSQKFTS